MSETQIAIRPFGTKIFVELDAPQTEKGGIAIPAQAQAETVKRGEGVVRFVGNLCSDEARDLIGKRVQFSQFAGDTRETLGKTYVVLNDEDDIHCVFE